MTQDTVFSDTIMLIANLAEAEAHARFNYLSTGKEEYLLHLDIFRKKRSKYMSLIEKEEESQLHCQNKHTLSAMFRCFEVGDKFLSSKDIEKAKDCYQDGYELLEIFVNSNWKEEGGGKWKIFSGNLFKGKNKIDAK